MKVTVDRKTWYRGQGSKHSRLQIEGTNERCCLGFACVQAGVPEEKIIGFAQPWWLAQNHPEIVSLLSFLIQDTDIYPGIEYDNKDWVTWAAMTNDNPDISDEKREKELKRLFASGGHEIEFIN